jgi:DNA polymerase-3 subunit gamma/tau
MYAKPMTYQPLHHKYRPQTFAELVGQEAITITLTNALRQQRIAPAYLFTGARGTGKTSSARILAKSLNCLQSPVPTATPCGQCQVCRAIARGSALDVIEIDAASNTGVDNIRDLIERAQFAPVQCRYKAYIIDEVHMLSTAAFNALLKTLEEPPDRVVFVLATTDPQRVLPTIISRCQKFDFRRIPVAAMVKHLRYIADAEQIPIAEDAITLVAQIAQGGLRDAESLLDQLSLLSGGIGVEEVWNLVGSVPEHDLISLLQAIANDHPETLLESVRRLIDRGREPLVVLHNLASFYRDLLIAKTAPNRNDLVTMTASTWETLCQFAQNLDIAAILAGQQHLRSCEGQLKSSTQPRLWLEVTLMGLLPSALRQPLAMEVVNQSSVRSPIVQPQSSVSSQQQPAVHKSASDRPTSATDAIASSAPEPPVISSPSLGELPRKTPADAQPLSTGQAPDGLAGSSSQAVPVTRSGHEQSGDEQSGRELSQVWQAVLAKLEPPSTRMLLSQQGCLLGLSDRNARVGITGQWHKTAKTKLPNLEAAFEKVLNHPVQIQLEVTAVANSRTAKENTAASAKNQPGSDRSDKNQPGSDRSESQRIGTSATDSSSPPVPSPRTEESSLPSSSGRNERSASQPQTPVSFAETSEPTQFPLPSNEYRSEAVTDSWREDEVTRAAKNLAEFFAGKVVDMGEDEEADAIAPSLADSTESDHSAPPLQWEAEDPDAEEDILF